MSTEQFTGFPKATCHAQHTSSEIEDNKLPESSNIIVQSNKYTFFGHRT